MIELRTRPLRATHADVAYLVQRPDELAALKSAVSYGFNAMLLGERGSGKTTLVNMLAAALEEEGWRVAQVTGGRFNSASEVLWDVARVVAEDAAGAWDAADRARGRGGDPLVIAYAALVEAVAELPDRTAILLDGLAPPLVHEVFGRMRDEMWALQLQWVVTGDVEDKAVLLAPPAEAFFERVVTLAPFSEEQIERLLTMRDPDGELGDHIRVLIAERCAGNPGRALVLARQALVSADPLADIDRGSVIEQVERELGEPAARLADDLARNGPSGPSDAGLLRRIGWSRPRAYQVFQALQRAGFTEVSTERTGRAGRPVHTYRLRGLA